MSVYSQTIVVCVALMIAAVGFYLQTIVRLYEIAGFGRQIKQINTNNCNVEFPRKLQGCEDILVFNVDTNPSILLGCSHDINQRRKWFPPISHQNSTIPGVIRDHFYVYNIEERSVVKLKMKGFPKTSDLVLHGFDLVANGNEHLLYAVNHKRQGNGSVIEKFSLQENVLTYLTTFDGNDNRLVNTPNAITVVDHRTDSFYVTNDHYYNHEPAHDVESLLLRPWSHVAFHSKSDGFKIVEDGLTYANGIAKYENKLFVVQSSLGELSVYDVHQDNNLTFVKKISFDYILDNIRLTGGDAYIAGHLSLNAMGKYFKNPNVKSPSAVAKLSIQEIINGNPVPEYVFSDNTGLMNSSTVAVSHSNILFISGLMSRGMLRCEL
ncbi:hypothetical protein AKO1_014016 [Acrasis kona]|uniref:Uncharacterized protein n=1 Tax=Acrasis kona TaxID=1008807 RepID=A0AAW2Z3J2_9EUKA